MMVCDTVYLGLELTSSVFPGDKSQSSEGIYDNWIPFGGFVFRQVKGSSEKALAIFHVFSSQ